MTLWFVLALMTLAAIFAVLWPLGRNAAPRADAAGSSVAVYRDQLDEIERDRASGRLSDADAESARIEISRRLLAAADESAASERRSIWGRRAAALAAMLLLPLVAVGFYAPLGSPQLPAAPLAERAREPVTANNIETLVSQVEAHLERNPTDGRGWEVLAPVYMRLGRFDDAVKARARALEFSGETADRRADLAEAQVAAANGIVTADAKQSFDRAVALDADNMKARFYLGLAAEQDGKRDRAAEIWRAIVAASPPNAPWLGVVNEALTRVGANVPPPAANAPGPSSDDVAAAATMSPQQRNEMISGMVARLAERLKTDGSDVESWLRLVRAYMVLGERDKARAAVADARRALAADPEKVQRIDAVAKQLDVEG
jgi:cytochrome c-type biogenesis protein CcmH